MATKSRGFQFPDKRSLNLDPMPSVSSETVFRLGSGMKFLVQAFPGDIALGQLVIDDNRDNYVV
jgi:hypothetical protein